MVKFSVPSGESRYVVRVALNGTDYVLKGILTYDLLAPHLGRSLVVLPAWKVFPELPPTTEQRDGLEKLQALLEEEQSQGSGRFLQVKGVVRQLARGERNYPGKGIAGHRYGAVPVLTIDTGQEHVLPNGATVLLRLGLYVSIPENRSSSRKSRSSARRRNGVASSVYFLDTLKIRPETLYRRYLEDVGEIFWAIEHKADLGRVFTWGKHIETVLAESVAPKLRESLDQVSRKGRKNPKLEFQLSREVREEGMTGVLQAMYGRLLALCLLNDLYGLLGIESRVGKYSIQLDNFVSEYQPLFARSIQEEFVHDETLAALRVTHEAFRSRSESGMSEPPDSVRNVFWVNQFYNFGRFLTLIRKKAAGSGPDAHLVLDPRFAKIFFSSIHNVPAGEVVYEKLVAALRDGNHHACVLAVREPPGREFKDLILARTWCSDLHIAVLPRQPRRFNGTEGNYDWIAKESALALLRGAEVFFALEAGAELDQIKTEFGAITDDLFPWADLAEARRKLLERLENYVHGEFAVTDSSRPLDERLTHYVLDVVRSVLVIRTDRLIKGFLSQFPPDLLLHMQYLQRARTGQSAAWMAYFLKQQTGSTPLNLDSEQETPRSKGRGATKAQDKFAALFKAASSRAIILDGIRYRLMSSRKRRTERHKTYFWELRNILRKLRPWADSEEIDTWEKHILEWADLQGGDPVQRN